MSERIIYAGFPGFEEAKMANMDMTWKEFPATLEGREALVKAGYMAVSIYEFSWPVEKGRQRPATFGDLIIDFDAKKEQLDEQGNKIKVGDIATSLDGLRNFIDLLVRKYGVNPDDLRYWASGGKGFHLLIPRELIGSQHGDISLPEIYRHMVEAITWGMSEPELHDGAIKTALANKDLPKMADFCIDENTFKMGKGQLIRLPHLKRADGNYKVPITHYEIMDKKSPFFEEVVKQDRHIDNEAVERNLEVNKELEKLYEFSKTILNSPARRKNGLSILETLEADCEFIDFCKKNSHEVSEPQWFILATLFGTLGEEGKAAFLEYSKLDKARFDYKEAMAKLSHASHYNCPTCKGINQYYQCKKKCKVKEPLGLYYSKKKKEIVMENFKIIDGNLVYLQDDEPAIVVCSAIELVALARDEKHNNWSKIFSFYDPDGIEHDCILHANDLLGTYEKAIGPLSKQGLQTEINPSGKKKLLEFLVKSDTPARARICSHYG